MPRNVSRSHSPSQAVAEVPELIRRLRPRGRRTGRLDTWRADPRWSWRRVSRAGVADKHRPALGAGRRGVGVGRRRRAARAADEGDRGAEGDDHWENRGQCPQAAGADGSCHESHTVLSAAVGASRAARWVGRPERRPGVHPCRMSREARGSSMPHGLSEWCIRHAYLSAKGDGSDVVARRRRPPEPET